MLVVCVLCVMALRRLCHVTLPIAADVPPSGWVQGRRACKAGRKAGPLQGWSQLPHQLDIHQGLTRRTKLPADIECTWARLAVCALLPPPCDHACLSWPAPISCCRCATYWCVPRSAAHLRALRVCDHRWLCRPQCTRSAACLAKSVPPRLPCNPTPRVTWPQRRKDTLNVPPSLKNPAGHEVKVTYAPAPSSLIKQACLGSPSNPTQYIGTTPRPSGARVSLPTWPYRGFSWPFLPSLRRSVRRAVLGGWRITFDRDPVRP